MLTNINVLLQERNTGIRVNARASRGEVICSSGRRSNRCRARIDAVSETADDAEDLEVSEARFSRGFKYKVRRRIEAVSCGRIIKAAAGTSRTKQKILRLAAG